jgi:exopolysaccharide biosynthesis protein
MQFKKVVKYSLEWKLGGSMGRRYKKPSGKVQLFCKSIRTILLLIFLQALIFCTFGLGMIYYGPFSNIREMLVTTSMATMNHQYIATWFLSDKKISEIIDNNKVKDEDKKSEESQIVIQDDQSGKSKEEDVKYIDISDNKIKGYLLIVNDPKRVRVATSGKIGKVGMKLLDIVQANNALGGINAGGFTDINGQGNGGTPQGLVIENGKVVYGSENVKYQLIGFNDESVLILGRYNLKEVREKKIRDAVTFGPFLIVNGEPLIKGGNGGQGIEPRTAIAQTKDGKVIFLVIDGRQIGYLGATLKDVQDILLNYGAYNAANLDGGASTTMVYKDTIINKPSSKYGPRYLPSAFIVQ